MPDYNFNRRQDQLEFNDDIRRVWNEGLYEIRKISTSSPSWTETVDGVPVFSVFGGTKRLYISDTSATNGWVYFTGTDL